MSRTLDALRQSKGDRSANGGDLRRDASEDKILASLGYPADPPPRETRRRSRDLGTILLGLVVAAALGAGAWQGAKRLGWLPGTSPVPAAAASPQRAAIAPTPAAPAPEHQVQSAAPAVHAPLVVPPPAPVEAEAGGVRETRRATPVARPVREPSPPRAAIPPPATAVPAAPQSEPPPRGNPVEADHFKRGLYYHRTGDFENALVHYRAVLEADELNVEAHNNLGLLYLDKKLYDEAIRAFRRATLIDDTYDKAHNNLGIALLNSGKADAAVAEFRRVVAQDPRNLEALSNLGTALKAVGRTDEAREVLQRAIALQVKYAPAHYNLALIYEESGDLVRAIQHYESFLASAGADNAALASDVRTRVQQLKAKLI